MADVMTILGMVITVSSLGYVLMKYIEFVDKHKENMRVEEENERNDGSSIQKQTP
jgi:hypothetical protein